jgi:metal-sulfur cluster biosynthetic enzyme
MTAMTQPAPDWAVRALSTVYDPCCRDKGISVVDMGLLRSVEVREGHARVELLLTSGWCPFAARVLTDVADAMNAQPGVDSCEVEVVWDEAWSPDRLAPSARRKLRFLPDPVAVGDRDAYLAAHTPGGQP